MTYLDEIIAYKKKEVEASKIKMPLSFIRDKVETNKPVLRDFKKSLSRQQGEKIKLIAELKKASPSKGLIRPDFDPVSLSMEYYEHGANAVSILTDSHFFQGNLGYLDDVRQIVPLPLLRKDFIVDEYQVWEALYAGADAILLIVAALSANNFQKLYKLATQLGLNVLVEVHTPEEATFAEQSEIAIMGINNRDLRTFQISLNTTFKVLDILNRKPILVSESGIKTANDVKRMSDAGIDALLIGETLMRSEHIGSTIKELWSLV